MIGASIFTSNIGSEHIVGLAGQGAATGMAMELNTSGLNKALPEMNPGRVILAEMQQRHIPVVVGADAHSPQRVAANFEEAFDLLRAVGYSQINIFLNRQRHALDIETARQSLRQN